MKTFGRLSDTKLIESASNVHKSMHDCCNHEFEKDIFCTLHVHIYEYHQLGKYTKCGHL